MKTPSFFHSAMLGGLLGLLLTGCATTAPTKEKTTAAAAVGHHDGKSYKETQDDEYAAATIPDPLEPINRVTFWVNHQVYTFIFRPISTTYKFVIPKVVRKGVYNIFDNVAFPVRFVNDALQGNFKRAGQETGRFVVNSTLGVGGFGRPADHMPALADVPPGETGITFAKWGIPHGAYFVIPLLGPSSLRDTVGLAGDYALNPVSWVSFIWGGYTWIVAIGATDTVSGVPDKLDQYDAATKNSLDRYLGARTAYAQYRKEAATK